VQHPSHANPPSLFLPLLAHAVSLEGAAPDNLEVLKTKAFLQRAWPRLQAWYSLVQHLSGRAAAGQLHVRPAAAAGVPWEYSRCLLPV